MAETQVDAGQILDGSLTDADVDAANKDGVAGTPSMRTLGTGAQQAAAGDHGHSGGVDGTAIHDDTAGEINGIAEKTTPVSADLLLIEDSADSNNKKKVQVGNLPGGGGGSDITVEDEGTPLTTAVTKLNFAGAGVTVTEPVADEMLVTIPGGGAGGTMPTLQARRTTTLALTTAYADVTLDATDEETDAADLEHDNTNTDRLTAKAAGTYLVTYCGTVDVGLATKIDARVRKNDASVVPGSEAQVIEGEVSSNQSDWPVSCSFVVTLAANDYLTFQAQYTGAASTLKAGFRIAMVKLEGSVGAQGPQGADGDITWEGAWDSGTTYSVNQAVESSGSAYVCILGHTNQAPPNATYWELLASKGDAGGNLPSVYEHSSSLAEQTTTSSTYVQKHRHTTASLAAGTYKISWSFDAGISAKDKPFGVQVDLDDTTVLSEVIEVNAKGDSYTIYTAQGGFSVKTGFSGVHTIDIDIKDASASSQTIRIRNICVEVWRVA